jgi:Amiloride-sensitive sodium channel
VKTHFCVGATKYGFLGNSTNCNECLKVLNAIKIPFDDIFVECKFGNQFISCKDSFEELIYERYLCYTFNGLKIYRTPGREEDITDDWSIDNGYKSAVSLEANPRRALGAGSKFGLSVILRNRFSDFDYFCTQNPATMVIR